MRRNKEKIYQVEIKPRLNFMGKFYITCIILFVLFVAYILIYREIHRDEIIENVKTITDNKWLYRIQPKKIYKIKMRI